MIQYEQFSETAKKLIEKFRNDDWSYKNVWPRSLLYAYITIDYGFDYKKHFQNEIDAVMALAVSKNYWLTDKIKKEENNGSV